MSLQQQMRFSLILTPAVDAIFDELCCDIEISRDVGTRLIDQREAHVPKIRND
jgi:hypothetical protein